MLITDCIVWLINNFYSLTADLILTSLSSADLILTFNHPSSPHSCRDCPEETALPAAQPLAPLPLSRGHQGRSSPSEATQKTTIAPIPPSAEQRSRERPAAPPGFAPCNLHPPPSTADSARPHPREPPKQLNSDLHIAEWPDLCPQHKHSVNSGRPSQPPISAHHTSRVPPGFNTNHLPVSHMQAVPCKEECPPGNLPTKEVQARTATLIQEAKSRAAEEEKLVSQVRRVLGYDRNKFHRFKTLSGWYRNSEISVHEYAGHCTQLLGATVWQDLGPRLARVLPDRSKRKELLGLFGSASSSTGNSLSEVTSHAWNDGGGGVGGRGPWLNEKEYPSLVSSAHLPDPPRPSRAWVPV